MFDRDDGGLQKSTDRRLIRNKPDEITLKNLCFQPLFVLIIIWQMGTDGLENL